MQGLKEGGEESAGALCAYLIDGLLWSVGTNAVSIVHSTSNQAAKLHLGPTIRRGNESTRRDTV